MVGPVYLLPTSQSLAQFFERASLMSSLTARRERNLFLIKHNAENPCSQRFVDGNIRRFRTHYKYTGTMKQISTYIPEGESSGGRVVSL